MKRWIAAAMVLAAAPAGAQVGNFQEGEGILGLAGQNDTQERTGVRLSPVGLNIGFIVQPIFGKRRLALVEQLSFFPVVHYVSQSNPFAPPNPIRAQPLIHNNLWMRVASGDPEEEGKFVYFAGGGMSLAITTPREGNKVAPMLSLGMRRWFRRQRGVEASLQCSAFPIGNTICVLPVTTLWPFG